MAILTSLLLTTLVGYLLSPTVLAVSELGNICNVLSFYKPYVGDKAQFYECKRVDNADWGIDVGVWKLRKCEGEDEEFIEQLQACKNKAKFRKQQTACGQNPQMGGCMQQQPCTATNANVATGNACSWMTAPLVAAPQSQNFMQCVPPNAGLSCGQWQQMPCQQGTQFNAQLQICVTISVQNTCGQQAAPVCGCGQQQPITTPAPIPVCPGTTSCNQGTCCQQLQQPYQPIVQPIPQPIYPQPIPQPIPYVPQPQPYIPQPMPIQQIPVCPGTQVQPVSGCSSGCQVGFQCQSGGCCPLPVCPQTGVQAVSSCSSGCPSGFGCYSGGCCQQQPIPQPPTLPPMPTCNNGQFAIMSCSGQCPMGYGCQNGGCCPQPMPQCWNGVPAIGPCTSGCPIGYTCQNGGCCQQQLATCPTGVVAAQPCSGGCPAQQSCFQGGCCPQAQPAPQPVTIQISIQLPICPGGIPSQTPCSGSCQAGFSCYQGGCCPPIQQPMPLPIIQQPVMPTCPTGVVAQTVCGGSCSTGFNCYQGGCCPQPLPTCPGGQQAVSTCDRGCPAGFSCYNGGCCRLQTCPSTGVMAPTFCNSGCPQQNTCVQGSCCPPPLPICPNGQSASAICTGVGQCPIGQSCQNGGCCPLPACPTGQLPAQECGVGGICPTGFACQLGGCCPVPMCPNGQVAIQSCGVNGMCPSGFSCQGGSCCPQPCPVCPNGAPSIQQCSGANCPDGYGCVKTGGCCLLASAPTCAAAQQPVCQCASNNMCPGGTGCNQGTCCASASVSVFSSQFPGAPCQASTQCTGFSSGAATCQSGYCQCQSGCWSNGVTCQQQAQQAQVWSPRSSCGQQFSSPCKLRFSAAKRKPVLEAEITEKTQPLFFRPLENVTRVCQDHNTCTPEEICVEKKCLRRMVPGEFGCERDEQCNYDCDSSYCDVTPKSKYLWQCKCRNANAFVEVGLCYKQCPDGTQAKGGKCKVIKQTKDFWENEEVQKKLLRTHSCGAEKLYRL